MKFLWIVFIACLSGTLLTIPVSSDVHQDSPADEQLKDFVSFLANDDEEDVDEDDIPWWFQTLNGISTLSNRSY